MIGSFASGTTASQVAKNRTRKLSQPLEELQGYNLELLSITPKYFYAQIFLNYFLIDTLIPSYLMMRENSIGHDHPPSCTRGLGALSAPRPF